MQPEEARAAALVTGGAKRVGRVLALSLARLGYDIALHYFSSKSDAESTAKEIEQLGRKSYLFPADFRNSSELEGLIKAAHERLPGLNVLVNNASIWNSGKLLDVTLSELGDYLRIHLETPFVLSREFAKIAQDGQIINILDSNIVKSKSDNFAYLLTKKALADFTLMAAAELAPRIRVNAIAPGAVLPPEDDRQSKYTEKFSKNPLERAGSPEDVALALEFIIASRHLSGQIIYTAGGKQLI